jgi:hypothetical protein
MLQRIALFLMVSAVCHADIYKWVDKDGTAHFGESARAGAERVQLQPLQVYSAPAQVTFDKQEHVKSEPAVTYNLSIASPTGESHLWNNKGEVAVVLSLTPDLQAGQKIRLLINDHIVSELNALTTQLSGLDRGVHKLQAQLLDAQSRTLANSQVITFYLHKTIMHPLVKK